MATLLNRGTVRFTPQSGVQSSVVSNTTSTNMDVTYVLDVAHAASPTTFVTGDSIAYIVLLRNLGTGRLVIPTVTVDLGGGALTYVPDSAAAFLESGTDVIGYPVVASVEGTNAVFSFPEDLLAGNTVYLVYRAVVNDSAGNTVVSTATGSASEGVATGPVVTDSDTATITRTPLTVVKSAPASVGVGDTISYVFTITNTGTAPITLDDLTDQLPAQFDLSSVTLSVGGVELPLVAGTDYSVSDTGLFTLDPAAVITLPAGAVAVVTLTGTVGA